MSLVWSEEDDYGIKALQMMRNAGRSFIVPENSGDAEFIITFKVEDYLKANQFLMELLYQDKTYITGITAISVGWGKDSTKIYEAQQKIQEAINLLNEA